MPAKTYRKRSVAKRTREPQADWETRLYALTGVKASSASKRIHALIQGMGDPEELVRVAAINEIERFKIDRLHALLLSSLSDRSALVRLHAGFALIAVIGRSDEKGILLHLAKSRSSQRIVLQGALLARGHANALSEILNSAIKTNNQYEVIIAARTIVAARARLPKKERKQVVNVFSNIRKSLRSRAVEDSFRELKNLVRPS